MAKSHSPKKAEQTTIEWRAVEDVIPYARNPRLVSEAAIAKVAASIREFGFRQPIVVDGKGVVIAGHTRLAAAKQLGLERVPVLVAADLSPEQVKAYRLADNRTAQETTWDLTLLPIELDELAEFDLDLALTGFEPAELMAYRSGAPGETDPYAEWDGMPDYEQDDLQSVFHVTVHFKSDTDAEAFFKLIGSEKRSWLWWPESDGHVGSSLHHQYVAVDGEAT
jgi:hypothetical protein